MSLVWRRIQRSNKKATKYRFTITPQELLIVGSEHWKPNAVVIACMHRRRRVEGKERKWEGSFADPCRGLIVWPAQTPDPLLVETTLYGDNSTREYDDKEWTLVVEERTAKGKRRTVAAVSLNMRLFVQVSVYAFWSTPGISSEVKLKMRPLWAEATHCSIQVIITSTMLGESDANDSDIKSDTSSVQGGRSASLERDIADINTQHINTQPMDKAVIAGISIVSNDIEQWKTKSMEDTTDRAVDSNKRWQGSENEYDENSRTGLTNAEPRRGVDVPIDKAPKQADDTSKTTANIPPSSYASKSVDERVTSSSSKSVTSDVVTARNADQRQVSSQTANITHRTENSVKSTNTAIKNAVLDEQKNKATTAGGDVTARSKLSEAESHQELPEVIEGEELLAWCQRVTQGYPSVKIVDFTRSFRSGLALCAIVHRYHPEMIGHFGALDFSDSHSGRRENCRKALVAAAELGVSRKLDAGVTVTLPERHEIRNFLAELRVLLEGAPSAVRRMSTKESDHRISALFSLSESETSVMRELESLRKQREHEEAIDLTNIPEEDRTKFDAVAPGSIKAASLGRTKQSRRLANPFDSDSDDEKHTSSSRVVNFRFVSASTTTTNIMRNGNVSGAAINGVSEGDDLPVNAVSPVVAARHEELLKKRRQIVGDTKLDSSFVGSDEERAKRLREEARRLMETAANEGATVFISESAPATTHQSPAVPSTSSNLQRRASAKLATSLGSQNELRCLEVATPSVCIYNFKKVQPSPVLQRKKYDTPLIPAFERPTQRLSNSQSDIRNDSWPSAFDRVKRYGSMRGQELADTVARMAGITVTSTAAPSANTAEATPTRKLVSHWEKDLEKMQEEQSKIADRLAEVSEQDEKICALLKRTKASSEEEERLLREHMRLLNEKDALVRRSEYFNVLEQLKEVQDEISALQKKLSSASCIEQEDKTEEDKQNIDRMMDELVELVNKKDQLSQKLIHHEAEDEEFDERDRLTLEATANFSRGYEQPISASKRLITWIRSEISS
ncbi:unnamed protein product [Toxocara canis]|uniref:EH domain-binding protein 1 n=1 Tax=Toxocara canis TaxID=6265 RepID=A0A183UT84_TOXCA|nr:unnamed protein product [Toxocara canis]